MTRELIHDEAASGVLRDKHYIRNPVTGANERAILSEPALSSLVGYSIATLETSATPPSLTRATTANQRLASGVLTAVSSGEMRHRHRAAANDGTTYRTALLERAATNELTDPEDLTSGNWTAVNLNTRTANQAGDPEGGSTLDEIVEDGTTDLHYVYQDATLTADADYAFSVFVDGNTRTFVDLRLAEAAAFGTNNVEAWFNLGTGAVGTSQAAGTGSLTRAYIEDWTDVSAGLYRCVVVGSVGNSATSIRAAVMLADADASVSYNGDGSSSLYAGHAMLEDAASVASSYHDGTRNKDEFSESISTTPADIEAAGGATFYSEWVELGTGFGPGKIYVQIGGPGVGDDPRFSLTSNSSSDGDVAANFDDGSTLATSTVPSSTTSLFDLVRARAVIYLDGSDWKIQLHVSVNGAAETSATAATIGSSLPASWSANTLTLNAAPGGTFNGLSGHILHRFATGVHTAAQMRAMTGGDIYEFTAPADEERPDIADAGGAVGNAAAEIVTASGEGITLPYDSALGTTVVKLTTGASGSATRAYRFGGSTVLNGFTANQPAAMLVGVYIPASSEVGFADVTLHAVDDQGSTSGTSATADGEWQWLWVDRTWDASATAAYFELQFADSVNLSGTDEVVYMALPTVVDAAGIGAPIDNATGSATSATTADDIYETRSSSALVESTGYLRFLEVGTAKAGGTILHFGSGTAGVDPRIVLDADSGYYGITLDDGTDVVTSRLSAAPAAGQLCELRYEILSTGAVRLHQSVNAATETSAAASSAPTAGLPSALAGDRIYYGSEAGTDHGAIPLVLHARFAGSKTLAECRAFAGV